MKILEKIMNWCVPAKALKGIGTVEHYKDNHNPYTASASPVMHPEMLARGNREIWKRWKDG